MPLVLTSSFPVEGNDEVFEHLKAMNATPRVAWIPPARDGSGRHFRIAREEFATHGFVQVQAIYLDDLPNWDDLSSAFDFVYLTGGSPILFRDKSLRVGLRERLRDFLDRGGVVIGASGGAMLLTQNVALFRLEGGTIADAVANHDALKAMGFIDYEILPHANRFDAALLGQLSTYARRVGCDVLALNDGAAAIHMTATDCRCVGAATWYTRTEHVGAARL